MATDSPNATAETYEPSVANPGQGKFAARVDHVLAQVSGKAGLAGGLAWLALAPGTGGLSLVPALLIPLAGKQASRIFTRKAASGQFFQNRLQSLATQVESDPAKHRPFKLQPAEETLLHGLASVPGGSDHFSEFFNGAYLRVEDGGALNAELNAQPGVHERMSSHASLGAQHEIDGRVTGPVLYGATADGEGTWVQMERDSGRLDAKGVINIPFHFQDFVQYKITHRNQSKYGTSNYTERNPLYLHQEAFGAPNPT